MNIIVGNEIFPVSSIASIRISAETNEEVFANNFYKFYIIYNLIDGRKIKDLLKSFVVKTNGDIMIDEMIAAYTDKYLKEISNIIWDSQIKEIKIEKNNK